MILTAHHPCLIIAMSSNGVLKPLLEAILGESHDLADESGLLLPNGALRGLISQNFKW